MASIRAAARALAQGREEGYGLLILTGAGMSTQSGVPVFRHADGSMSAEFLAFLDGYNRQREKHGLSIANDWFSFSVSGMFRHETEKEAWDYWRWRMLRAMVAPGEDYRNLEDIIQYFGKERFSVDALRAHSRVFCVYSAVIEVQRTP